jgi:hypothetical protein
VRKDLIAALGTANINWAGWGYCAGKNWMRDKGWISDFRDDLGMQAFVIDSEPEEKNDKDVWSEDDFKSFLGAVRDLFGKNNLAISTWPVLQIREKSVTKLMKIATPFVSLFAPQAYWMNHPSDVHYKNGFSEAKYPRDDPESYVRLVVDSWSLAGISAPLVVTGQAYWSKKEETPPKGALETKLDQFTKTFAGWAGVYGFNWYHAGGTNTDEEGSMSDAMIASIAGAKLGSKPYKH